MKSLSECVAELTVLIKQGQTLEAMQQFYADDVTMQENETPPRVGKEICLEHERRMLSSVTDFKAKSIAQSIDEVNNVVFSEWVYEFAHLSGQRFSLKEVSVQHWNKELIQTEKFYYHKTLLVT